jgi:magnesium-transporting ATPase (P-type)
MELITSERIQDEVVPLTETRKKEIYMIFTQLASEGKRVLAMAYRDFEKNEE